MIDVVLSHWGLATTTVAHAVLTLVTGVALVVMPYDDSALGEWREAVLVAHVVLGLLMIGYLVATYLVTPY